jgi:hypothetical protein
MPVVTRSKGSEAGNSRNSTTGVASDINEDIRALGNLLGLEGNIQVSTIVSGKLYISP